MFKKVGKISSVSCITKSFWIFVEKYWQRQPPIDMFFFWIYDVKGICESFECDEYFSSISLPQEFLLPQLSLWGLILRAV